jgi:hypothetical protein
MTGTRTTRYHREVAGRNLETSIRDLFTGTSQSRTEAR